MKAAVVDVRRVIQGRGEGTTFSLVKLSNADHRHREVDLIRITEARRYKKRTTFLLKGVYHGQTFKRDLAGKNE